MPPDGNEPLGIVALGGGLPVALAAHLAETGRPFFCVCVSGLTSPAIKAYPHSFVAFFKIGQMFAELRRAGCRKVAYAGQLFRPAVHQMRFDWKTLRYLPLFLKAHGSGDDSIMRRITAVVEAEGFEIVSLREIAPKLAAPAGIFAGPALAPKEREDIAVGLKVVRNLGAADVGQAAVVDHGRVIAVEAAEGTDAMLQRVQELRGTERYRAGEASGVLIKAAKPQQELRNDMPVIGLATVRNAIAAGLRVIAVEAGRVICADLPEMIAAADQFKLTLFGISDKTNG